MFKKYFQNKKGVLFDMDGTVIDSVGIWTDAFAAVLEQIEAYWVDPSMPDLVGHTVIGKWHYILDLEGVETKHSAKELTAFTHAEFLKRLEWLQVRDGFWQFVFELKEEKKLKLGMTTNTVREVTAPVAQKLGLTKVFDVIIAGDEVKHPKPHPEIYKTAAKKLGLSPKNILVFEDSVAGAESATRAGMDVFVIWDGEAFQNDYPESVAAFLPDFSNLESAMETDFMDELRDAGQDLKTRMAERKKKEAEAQ